MFLDASSQSSLRFFYLFIRFIFGLGGMHCLHSSVAGKSGQRLPPSLFAALPFNITCKPILLSDPAHAVLHSARSAREISEVLWSRHRRESHQANLAKGSAPPLTPTSHYLFLQFSYAFNMHREGTETLTCISLNL